MFYSHFDVSNLECYTLLFPVTCNQRISPPPPRRFISQEPIRQQQFQPQNKGQRLRGLDGFWPPERWGVWILFIISYHLIIIFKEPTNQRTMSTERSILILFPANHVIVGVPFLHLISDVNLYNEDDAIYEYVCVTHTDFTCTHIFEGNWLTGNVGCFIYFLVYMILF